MRRVMGRPVGLSCLLAVVAACGGAQFSSGGFESGADGSTLAGDAAGDDGATGDASPIDATSGDAPVIGIRDAARDRDFESDVTIGSDGAASDAAGTADSGSSDANLDAGAGDSSAPDATPADAGGGSDASCVTLTCGSLCCPATYHCCNGGSTTPSCVPKNALCPL
jgi:hypothetical protein